MRLTLIPKKQPNLTNIFTKNYPQSYEYISQLLSTYKTSQLYLVFIYKVAQNNLAFENKKLLGPPKEISCVCKKMQEGSKRILFLKKCEIILVYLVPKTMDLTTN
jgi:hypothetical protein